MLKPVCPKCGSDLLVCDAVARWNIEQQAWVIIDPLNNVSCHACDEEEIEPVWVPAA